MHQTTFNLIACAAADLFALLLIFGSLFAAWILLAPLDPSTLIR